jgi:hypothetical protein
LWSYFEAIFRGCDEKFCLSKPRTTEGPRTREARTREGILHLICTKNIAIDNKLFQKISWKTDVQQTIHTLFFKIIDAVKATKRPPHLITYTLTTAIKENLGIEVFVALERALFAQTNHASITLKVRSTPISCMIFSTACLHRFLNMSSYKFCGKYKRQSSKF